MCGNYPCEKYEKVMEFDSFITHQNMVTDGLKAGDEIVSEGAGLVREGTQVK